ncbi:MAG TPA: zinc-ribbon domain containing protein [Chloroflexota bacterium]
MRALPALGTMFRTLPRFRSWSTFLQPEVRTMRAMLLIRHADVELRCRCCGGNFVYSAGEQELNAIRGVTHEPSVCPSCRKLVGRS